MGKFGLLEVDTLNIAANAVTGFASGAPVSVPNPAGMPIEVHTQATISYAGNNSSATGSATFQLRRNRDNAVLYSFSRSFTGATNFFVILNVSVLDNAATSSETYSVTSSALGGFTTVTTSIIRAIYTKK